MSFDPWVIHWDKQVVHTRWPFAIFRRNFLGSLDNPLDGQADHAMPSSCCLWEFTAFKFTCLKPGNRHGNYRSCGKWMSIVQYYGQTCVTRHANLHKVNKLLGCLLSMLFSNACYDFRLKVGIVLLSSPPESIVRATWWEGCAKDMDVY